ncbi:hypothetical protein J3R82DRAFT_9177 [Butyriboletus roseoflavus]|nr:hypothetical protein J3R82DRAFT_9177 [Butyriboletus roseoflavus]
MHKFAMSDDIKLPAIKKQLLETLRTAYTAHDWGPVFKIVMDAENDVEKALVDLHKLTILIFGCLICQISILAPSPCSDLTFTLEKLLNPVQKQEIEESAYEFSDGDDKIVTQVKHELAVEQGEVTEVENKDKEPVKDGELEIMLSEAIGLCKQMEQVLITYGTSKRALDLS